MIKVKPKSKGYDALTLTDYAFSVLQCIVILPWLKLFSNIKTHAKTVSVIGLLSGSLSLGQQKMEN